jgi:predicted PurR-regulated permease PerM
MAAGVPGASLIAFGVLILGIIQIGPTVILVAVIIWSWPIIFARGLKTPMLVIIVGVVGGTLSNGIIGLFVGPIVLAVAWDLLVAYVRESDTAPT